MMQIPDPIHGYISLSGMYADIVNTPEFQRLRSVEQGSFRPVYPGAAMTGLSTPWAPTTWPPNLWSTSSAIWKRI